MLSPLLFPILYFIFILITEITDAEVFTNIYRFKYGYDQKFLFHFIDGITIKGSKLLLKGLNKLR